MTLFVGSPFQFTVGPITEGGADKVRALGDGLQRGIVNTPGRLINTLGRLINIPGRLIDNLVRLINTPGWLINTPGTTIQYEHLYNSPN